MKQNPTIERPASRIMWLAVSALSINAVYDKPAYADGVAIHQCVIVSKSLDTIFLTGPDADLFSLNLATGRTQWSSTEGVVPLGVMNGELLVQGQPAKAGTLELISLSASEGQAVDRRSVSLPSSVHAAPLPGPGRAFAMSASPGAGGFRLQWNAMTSPLAARGAAGQEAEGNGKLSNGAVDVRMGKAKFSAAASSSLAKTPAAPMLSEVNDIKLGGTDGRKFISADGKHLLVSERRKNALPVEAYRWSIYDMESEKLLGQATSPISVSPFVVSGSTLIYTTPEMSFRSGAEVLGYPSSVRARDLNTGSEVWSHEIPSLVLKGPFPH